MKPLSIDSYLFAVQYDFVNEFKDPMGCPLSSAQRASGGRFCRGTARLKPHGFAAAGNLTDDIMNIEAQSRPVFQLSCE